MEVAFQDPEPSFKIWAVWVCRKWLVEKERRSWAIIVGMKEEEEGHSSTQLDPFA
jgi:hypothetical protein